MEPWPNILWVYGHLLFLRSIRCFVGIHSGQIWHALVWSDCRIRHVGQSFCVKPASVNSAILRPVFFVRCLWQCHGDVPAVRERRFWFTHKPGLALGITASGGAVGQAVVPYLCAVSLELYGWQTTYMLSAACYLALALPVALLIRESPGREQARLQLVDEERTFPLSEREVIIWISVAIIFCCTCMSVPIVHLVPLLTDSGFSLDQATTVLMVLMFSGALGRILGGGWGI